MSTSQMSLMVKKLFKAGNDQVMTHLSLVSNFVFGRILGNI